MAQIRLTKKMREDIVQRIMNDVPKEDYMSKATDLLVKGVQRSLPKEIQALLGTPLQDHLTRTSIRVTAAKGATVCAYIPGATHDMVVPDTVKEEVVPLLEKFSEQRVQRNKLQEELEVIFASFSTVEKLRDKFPQFDKYLPNAEQPTFPVAIVSDVLSNLQQAGWPKGTKKP